jgi:hypothetical protein
MSILTKKTIPDMGFGMIESWDYYKCRKDQKVESKLCRVCGQTMLIENDLHEPWRKFSGGGYDYDLFKCPDALLPYHQLALCIKIKLFIEPSQYVSELYEKEISFLLLNKKPTKVVADWRIYLEQLGSPILASYR